VTLGGKVHDQLGTILVEQGHDRVEIGDAHMFEAVVRRAGDRREVDEIGRVGQRVGVDEVMAGESWNEEVDEVRPDEPRATRDEYVRGVSRRRLRLWASRCG
jgi:hypothetical protein